PARGAPRRRTNRGRSWCKTAPHPQRHHRTKGKFCSFLASTCYLLLHCDEPPDARCRSQTNRSQSKGLRSAVILHLNSTLQNPYHDVSRSANPRHSTHHAAESVAEHVA